MAHHTVHVQSKVAAQARTRTSDSRRGTSDASHLRPLSEGVLKSAGLHGGVDERGAVRDLRGLTSGAVDVDPFTLPSDELHVQLLRLQHKTGGVLTRDVNADGSVTLKLTHGEGDTTSARGDDTAAAAAKLLETMGITTTATKRGKK